MSSDEFYSSADEEEFNEPVYDSNEEEEDEGEDEPEIFKRKRNESEFSFDEESGGDEGIGEEEEGEGEGDESEELEKIQEKKEIKSHPKKRRKPNMRLELEKEKKRFGSLFNGGGIREDSDIEPIKLDQTHFYVNPNDGTRLVLLESSFKTLMKPHQLEGLRFLWKKMISQKTGCILAQSMGLGKTLQVIAFVYLVIREKIANRLLVLCPKSVVGNWDNENTKWCKKAGMKKTKCYLLNDSASTIEKKLDLIESWDELGGMLVMSYNTFQTFAKPSKTIVQNPKRKKLYDECFQLACGADIAILDEGHKIKNNATALYSSLLQLNTLQRCILTGTPLQNNLHEYWTMSSFVRPNVWPEVEFKKFFQNPIQNGQLKDASFDEIRLMKRRSYLLSQEMKTFVHRRDQSILKIDLPPKFEFVVNVGLSQFQRDLYAAFLKQFPGKPNILYFTSVLGKIVSHPDLIRDFATSVANRGSVEASFGDFLSDEEDGGKYKQPIDKGDLNKYNDVSWADSVMSETYKCNDLKKSPKMEILWKIVEIALASNEKVLIFSQFCKTLDKIEELMKTNKLGGKIVKNQHDYVRLDGSVSLNDREDRISDFNERSSSQKIFLISTRAGGVGINLTSASRVVLMDVCWNPSDDSQSIFRAYRYGQTKPVFVYRLIGVGTVEEKVWKRCIGKNWVFQRVIDEKTPVRLLTKDDFNFYEFESEQKSLVDGAELNIQILKDDPLLGEIKNPKIISVVEHESLFVHDDGEIISIEEQALADIETRGSLIFNGVEKENEKKKKKKIEPIQTVEEEKEKEVEEFEEEWARILEFGDEDKTPHELTADPYESNIRQNEYVKERSYQGGISEGLSRLTPIIIDD